MKEPKEIQFLQFFVQLLFGVPERCISGFNLFGNFLIAYFLRQMAHTFLIKHTLTEDETVSA